MPIITVFGPIRIGVRNQTVIRRSLVAQPVCLSTLKIPKDILGIVEMRVLGIGIELRKPRDSKGYVGPRTEHGVQKTANQALIALMRHIGGGVLR